MTSIPLQSLPTSKIIAAYLNQDSGIRNLYDRNPKLENYEIHAREKIENYKHRETLVEVLQEQMQSLNLSEKQKLHLEKLASENAVTITTGHQLNLMSGPLYFVYKILQTVKTCDELNAKETDLHFVPIYWMATEDHDWDEVNNFEVNGVKFQWSGKESNTAVGKRPTEDVATHIIEFLQQLPDFTLTPNLQEIIEKSYAAESNFTNATKRLVQTLLGEYGILILDASDARLKKLFAGVMQNELIARNAQNLAEKNNEILQKFSEQAFIREINLFYLTENKRERIVYEYTGFSTADGAKQWSEEEILQELQNNPERFSPNVILRPLYQECILPNVSYIGGGGEIAYWLQLKPIFENYDISMPILVVRNSLHFITQKDFSKFQKYGIKWHDFFESEDDFIKPMIEKNTELLTLLDEKYAALKEHFADLRKIAVKTSPVYENMLNAQEQKQLNGYHKLRKRIYKSEALRMSVEVKSWKDLRDAVLPGGSWQERKQNMLGLYAEMGDQFFEEVYQAITPFDSQYHVIPLKPNTK
ncbi:MAG: bacillithiol biosynthesis cysteine-adding enzyme BshC [Weeksellaceae bacterium]|nr:bacillithiol biosynthesis cysteine-adding enzyme BshC [Weeksellaceae bacterium]